MKANELEQLQSKLYIEKSKAVNEGEIEAVLSTDDLDRHGEHVSIKGLVVPKDQVIKMYYNHETYGDKLPIGKWLRIWKANGKLMGHGVFDLEDSFAYKVYRKVQNGFIDSISIGFYPQEYDGETSTWTKSTLVEASVVAEPANTNAVITSKELGFTQEEFKKELKEKLAENTESSTAGAGDTEIKAALESLKSRVDAVEDTLKASTEGSAIKQLIKVRMAAKQVDIAAGELNKTLKVKLKGHSNVSN